MAALESSSCMKILDKVLNVFLVQCCVKKGMIQPDCLQSIKDLASVRTKQKLVKLS